MNTFFKIVSIPLMALFTITSTAQYVNIPDANFRAWLNNNGYASCMNSTLMDTTCSLIVNATKVNCAQSNISDLDGIQYFDNLDTLICYSNSNIISFPAIHASLLYLDARYLSNLTSYPFFPPSLLYINVTGNGSGLTSLPTLPPGLIHLGCSANDLTVLPTLPATLTYLDCSYNLISALPALPSGLQLLTCSNNSLTNLPSLPAGLSILDCSHNQLPSLPTLPNSLTVFDCAGNQLTNLPALPNGLLHLFIDDNSISGLPNVPASLQQFKCKNNLFTSLPLFPNSLSVLDCSNNLLTSLPAYSTSLLELYCSTNFLTSLDPLPVYLNKLSCDHNQLSALPVLTPYLDFLNCSNNPITILPALPASLSQFYCDTTLITNIPALPSGLNKLSVSDCQLTVLPDLPDTMNYLDISYTPLTCLPHILNIFNFKWSGTNLTCLPNVVQIFNPSPSVSSLGLCQPSGNCPTFWNISGNVYNDVNSDCLNNAEDNLEYIPVILDSSGIFMQMFLTDVNGNYSFRTFNGSYTVHVDTTQLPFDVFCPASFSHTSVISTTNTHDSLANFGLQCKSGFDLVSKDITPSSMIRPGAQPVIHINAGDAATFYGTSCANGIGGSVQAVISGPASYLSAAAGAFTPTSVTGDTITWNVNDFSLSSPTADFNFIAQVASSATTSDTICVQLSAFPLAGDNNISNNTFTSCYPVLNSFDPNEKYMSPSGDVDTSQQWFDFVVFFQNTGNAPAEDIYILDSLSVALDASTFTFLSSSHEVTTQLLPGNVLRFNFPDINLPDSTTNEPASHGNVHFKIKRKDALPPGTVISNLAYIYFDYNPPIVTNSVSATLTLPLSVYDLSENSVTIYPNPTNGIVYLSTPSFPVYKVEIYSMHGENVFQNKFEGHTNMQINLSHLTKGMYFIKFIGEKVNTVQKIIKL